MILCLAKHPINHWAVEGRFVSVDDTEPNQERKGFIQGRDPGARRQRPSDVRREGFAHSVCSSWCVPFFACSYY